MEYNKLKGTYDIPPSDADFYRWMENTILDVMEKYGYKRVVFPVIEYANLFTRGVGESSDIVVKKEMYQFEDQGHRQIALRPEGTASAVRLYLENGLSMQGYSAKLAYVGPMFRAEKPQAGRYRQFVQFGAEYLGDGSPFADIELIQMNRDIFDVLGISGVTTYINTIGCKACRPKYLETLKTYFADKIENMCVDCKARYNTNVLRILDCKEEKCRASIDKAPSMLESLCEECKTHFETVKNGLSALKIEYTLDERLVRGLDYYNRTVFEFKSSALGSQSTVSAGGRYDYLVREFGGMETPGAGFAMGMERLGMVVEASLNKKKEEFNRPPDVYVAAIGEEYRVNVAQVLNIFRQKGLTAVTEYRYSALKKHLKSADGMKARFALFIGENEVKAGIYTLRNLSDGSQEEMGLEEAAEKIGGEK